MYGLLYCDDQTCTKVVDDQNRPTAVSSNNMICREDMRQYKRIYSNTLKRKLESPEEKATRKRQSQKEATKKYASKKKKEAEEVDVSIKNIENDNEKLRQISIELEELISFFKQQNKVVTEPIPISEDINFRLEPLPELADLVLNIGLDSTFPADDFLPDEVQESIFSGMFNVYEINPQENLNLFNVNINQYQNIFNF